MLEFMLINADQSIAVKGVEAVCPGVPVFSQRIRLHFPDRGDDQEWVAWTFDSPSLAQVTAEIQLTRPDIVAFQWWGI